ncbi:MAG: hypothetical protein ACLT0R_16325 [Paraclostridium sordellii]
MKEQTIKGEIVKVGRKYLHIVQEGRNIKYPEQMIKNELVENLKVGDKFEQFVQSEGEKTYTGAWKWTHTPTKKEKIVEEKRQAEIKKWWGYVQQNFREGRIYYNGISNLHKLKCNDYDEEIERMTKEIECKNAIYWIRKNAENENKLYKKGLDTLKKHNCTDYNEEINEIKSAIKKVKEIEESKKTMIGYPYTGYSSRPKYGQVIVQDNKAWKINRINKEDEGMSFGYMTEYWWRCECIDISDTEEGIQALIKNEKIVAKNEKIQKVENELKAVEDELNLVKRHIQNIIEENDILKGREETYPNRDEIEIIFDDINIHGGGSSIFIKDNKAWNFINNGFDGDMWSMNHIKTWGAGGFGYICDVEYVKDSIDKYKELKEVSNKINEKLKEVTSLKI